MYPEQPKPYALYIHGFGSGAASGTKTSLGHYISGYEWLAPELSHDPYDNLELLQNWVDVFQPALIAGTSMGGFLALFVDAPRAVKLAVNPVWNMEQTLRKMGYGKHKFHCEREDGATEYVVDEALARRYIQFRSEHPVLLGKRNLAVFSTDDELVGKEPSKKNAAVVKEAGFDVLWCDKMGHRLNDKAAKAIAQMCFPAH